MFGTVRILCIILPLVIFSGTGLAGKDPETLTSFVQLEDIIRNHQARSIDALLPWLPESFRRHYVFVYDSQSAQTPNVFPDQPRTIVFDRDAKFLMAFGKDPKKPPVVDIPDTLETIEFLANERRFVFRELTFDGETDPLASPPEENPPKCLACHGADPRPNWQNPSLWPGAFGSFVTGQGGCARIQAGTNEASFYSSFMKKYRRGGRFRFLVTEAPPPDGCEASAGEVLVTDGDHEDSSPPHVLLERLAFENSYRVERIVESAPGSRKFRSFIRANLQEGLQHCPELADPEAFFPPGYAAKHGVPTYAETRESVRQQSSREFSSLVARFQKNNKASAGHQPTYFMGFEAALNQMSRIKMIADRLHLSMYRWTTDFSDGTYGHYLGDIFGTYAGWYDPNEPPATCAELREISVKALSGD